MLFEPVGMLGALAGLALMAVLIIKDYKPLLNFGIGPSQELAIFGGCVLTIVGISFMTTGNTFLSAALGPIILQFEGLTEEKVQFEPKRKVRGIKRPVRRLRTVKAPAVPLATALVPVPPPVPEPASTKVEAPAIPIVEAPAPAVTVAETAPAPEPLTEERPGATWSDTRAEEMALEALKEAEAELGLQEMEAQVESDLVKEPEKSVAEAPTKAPEVVEVFECPSCHHNVAESDTICPHCGVSFEGDEAVGEEAIEAEVEEEEAPRKPAPPLPKPPPLLPPPLPPPPPPKAPPKPKEPDLLEEIEKAPPVTKVAPPAPTKADEDDTDSSSQPSVLQSILDEISKKDDTKITFEEPEPVDDETSEVPRTCPNCGRKIKPRWRSCPFCGLEFH